MPSLSVEFSDEELRAEHTIGSAAPIGDSFGYAA